LTTLIEHKVGTDQTLDYNEFVKFFKKHDADNDGALDKDEVLAILMNIVANTNP